VYHGKTNGKQGIWEALVEDDVFRLVEAKLSDPRRKTQQGTDRRHLGAGLFECDKCNSKVRSWSGDRYRCPNGCLTGSHQHIDALVIKTIRERLGRSDLADLIAPKESNRAKAASEEVKRLNKRLERIEAGDIDGHRFTDAPEHAERRSIDAVRRRPDGGVRRRAAHDPPERGKRVVCCEIRPARQAPRLASIAARNRHSRASAAAGAATVHHLDRFDRKSYFSSILQKLNFTSRKMCLKELRCLG
jgi:hypothetical protein